MQGVGVPGEAERGHPEGVLPAGAGHHLGTQGQHVVGQRHVEGEGEGGATRRGQGQVPDDPGRGEVWGEAEESKGMRR